MPINEITPSLGELASAGQSGAPVAASAAISTNDLVQNLNQNARFKAQNDWNKYLNFQDNLKDAYANAAAVEQMDVLSTDKPELQKDAKNLYSFIAKNPDAFSGKNQELAGEMQAMYGNLISKATLSKQDNLFDKANRGYLVQNNELNTDENKKVIDEFAAKPLGTRKAYNLNLPTILDINAYTKGILDSPSVKTSFATSEVTPDNQFIIEKEGTKYDRKSFIDKFAEGLNVESDKYGHSIKGYVKDLYKTVPDEVKQMIPGKTEDEKLTNFWKMQGEKMFNSPDDITETKKENRQANPNYLKPEKLQLDKDELKEKIRHDKAMEGLGWERIKSGIAEDDDAAMGSIIEINDVIDNATRPENLKYVVDPKGNRQQYGTISDPELIKRYTTIDKTGKITSPPDDAVVDRTSGQISLVYYKKKGLKGEVQKSPQGAAIIEKSIPVNTSTWVSAVISRNENAKNKGKVNNLVQQFYQKNGGVYEGARKMNQAEKGKQEAKNKTVDLNTLDPNGFKKEGDNYRYKDGTLFDAQGNIVNE